MKFRLILCLAIVAGVISSASNAYAVPPFLELFKKTYAGDGASDAWKNTVKDTGCKICHVKDKPKKEKSDYGKALAESGLAKSMGDKLKADDAETVKAATEAMKKAEEKKNAAGKPFGEALKSGKLP